MTPETEPSGFAFFHHHVEACEPRCVLFSFGAEWQIEPLDEAEAEGGLSDKLDRWAARLDRRFKRANLGEGCWNCGCPDAQYVRSVSEEDARGLGGT